MKVYKYKLIWGYTHLDLPEGAQVLHFDIQRNEPCIWALVDPDAPKEERLFLIVGTGHPIMREKEEMQFIGTALMQGGSLVWHVFEVRVCDEGGKQ